MRCVAEHQFNIERRKRCANSRAKNITGFSGRIAKLARPNECDLFDAMLKWSRVNHVEKGVDTTPIRGANSATCFVPEERAWVVDNVWIRCE